MCQSRSLEKEKEEPIVQKHTLVSIDLAKTEFEIAISHEPGRIAGRPASRAGSEAQINAIVTELPLKVLLLRQAFGPIFP